MYCSIKYTHDVLVIFIPLEALFLVNSQLDLLSFTPLRSKIFLKENLSQFYQLQTLLMSAELFTKGRRLQMLRRDRF